MVIHNNKYKQYADLAKDDHHGIYVITKGVGRIEFNNAVELVGEIATWRKDEEIAAHIYEHRFEGEVWQVLDAVATYLDNN